jgi:hypothetical protein
MQPINKTIAFLCSWSAAFSYTQEHDEENKIPNTQEHDRGCSLISLQIQEKVREWTFPM